VHPDLTLWVPRKLRIKEESLNLLRKKQAKDEIE
jgi:hypothetical protein